MSVTDFKRLSGMTDDYSAWRRTTREEDSGVYTLAESRIHRLANVLDEERYGATRLDQFDPEITERLYEAAAVGDETAAHLVKHHEAAKAATAKATAAHKHAEAHPHDAKAQQDAYHAHANAAQLHNNAALVHARHGSDMHAMVHGRMAKHHEQWAEAAAMAAHNAKQPKVGPAHSELKAASKHTAAAPKAPAKAPAKAHAVHAEPDPFPSKKSEPAKIRGAHERGAEKPGMNLSHHAHNMSKAASSMHVDPSVSHKELSHSHKKAAHSNMLAAVHALRSGDTEGLAKHMHAVMHHASKSKEHHMAGTAQKRTPIPAGPRASTGRVYVGH